MDIIAGQDLLGMTGRQLLQRLGMFPPDGQGGRIIETGEVRIIEGEKRAPVWTVRTTSGRGRASGKRFVHLSRPTVLRVVDPQGNDTGGRVNDVLHLRGAINQPIRDFQEV